MSPGPTIGVTGTLDFPALDFPALGFPTLAQEDLIIIFYYLH